MSETRPRPRDYRFTRRWIIGVLGVVACAFVLGFQPPPTVTLVHSPYLQNLGADHVTIVWSTRDVTGGDVGFSLTSREEVNHTATFPSWLRTT